MCLNKHVKKRKSENLFWIGKTKLVMIVNIQFYKLFKSEYKFEPYLELVKCL